MLAWNDRRRVLGGALVLVLALMFYGLSAARSSEAGGADVAVLLTPMPNVGVTAGSIITYQIQVRNFDADDANRVLIHMPYDPYKLQVLDANFTADDDWVTAVQGDYLTLAFGRVGGNSSRTATVRLYVQEYLPVGTVINMWAGYGWDDGDGGASGRSANAAPVVVEAQAISSGATWLEVAPTTGPTGTIYSFFSNRFAPGERVTTTLNAPYGPQPLNLTTTADARGEIRLIFDSTGYPPGTYELVVRGERTAQIAATHFTIE